MKSIVILSSIAALGLAACASYPPPPERVIYAGPPGQHPSYKHAISDLQAAEGFIDRRRPEDRRIAGDEQFMHDELNAALADLHRADEVDGKFGPLPAPDVGRLPEGPLHAAIELMRRAQADVARAEDNPRARPLQQHALDHIGAAMGAANSIDRQVSR